GMSLQRSWHARQTAPRRVRSVRASNFRIESRARIILFVLLPELGRPIARACANKNPAGGAPRRGDCSPDAEGRVHLLPGRRVILSPKRPPVGSIRDSGTQNLWLLLNVRQAGAPPSPRLAVSLAPKTCAAVAVVARASSPPPALSAGGD